ncbi:hypothetical protein D3C72_2180800 [compost metagenome]
MIELLERCAELFNVFRGRWHQGDAFLLIHALSFGMRGCGQIIDIAGDCTDGKPEPDGHGTADGRVSAVNRADIGGTSGQRICG